MKGQEGKGERRSLMEEGILDLTLAKFSNLSIPRMILELTQLPSETSEN